jgi:hypothetical protein
VLVKNQTKAEYQGTISLQGPDAWRLAPPSRDVTLAAGETESVSFSISEGRNVAANKYRFEVRASTTAGDVVRRQDTFVASAPYFKPTVDGSIDDWQDAIPITFVSDGKMTQVSTYWSRRSFSLLVAVEEDKLQPYGCDASLSPDAVQFCLAPIDPGNGAAVENKAGRFEFLIVSTDDGARCFQLATMETDVAQIRQRRPLEPLAYDDADVVVRRDGTMTYYECTLPFRPMRDAIRPTEGREFYMSVLVHDPDGTGLRDLGAAAGLWPSSDDADAWSRWVGDRRNGKTPLGNKILWGMCTSKY